MPKQLLFNTRSDSASTSPFWKEKFEENRCIIVRASSFFEWQGEKGEKTKYEVVVSVHKFFGMAGLWVPWKNPKTEKWEDTFSIFTSDPNGVMVPVHDRQPVILEPHEFEEWLSITARAPVHLLRMFSDERMKMMSVEGETPMISQLNLDVCVFFAKAPTSRLRDTPTLRPSPTQ